MTACNEYKLIKLKHSCRNFKLQSAPKKGRRAGLSFPFSLSPRDDDRSTPQDSSTPSKDSIPPSAPPRTRRSGGWADETSKSEK